MYRKRYVDYCLQLYIDFEVLIVLVAMAVSHARLDMNEANIFRMRHVNIIFLTSYQ